MTSRQPQRPIFWFLWPSPPALPLDADAVQTRWLRVTGRGPWRLAFLLLLSGIVLGLAVSAVLALLTAPTWSSALITLVVGVPIVALTARAWVMGTSVCDRGIKVATTLHTAYLPWSAVDAIEVAPARVRLLGTPLRISGHAARALGTTDVLVLLTSGSADLWCRPEAWDIAVQRLHTWRRESPR